MTDPSSKTVKLQLPTTMGTRIVVDPPLDTPINALLPYPSQHKRRAALKALCEKYKTVPACYLLGLEGSVIPFLGLKEFSRIRALFTDCTQTLEEKNLKAYKAFVLFGHLQRVDAFRQRWQGDLCHIGKLIDKIDFPPPEEWANIDFRRWGDMFYTYGFDKIRNLFVTGGHKQAPLNGKDGVVSFNRTSFALSSRKFNGIIPEKTLAQIAGLAAKWDMNANEYDRALRTYATRVEDPSHQHTLPEMYIDGERFNMPGTAFYALDRDDPVKLFIGNYTGCCEKVSDIDRNIEETIEHSYMHTGSTFYVVSDGSNILAHSWAWRGNGGSLCFDGFESKPESGFSGENMMRLLDEVIKELHGPDLSDFEMHNVYVGTCVEHIDVVRQANYDYDPVDQIKPLALGKLGMNKMLQGRTISYVPNFFGLMP